MANNRPPFAALRELLYLIVNDEKALETALDLVMQCEKEKMIDKENVRTCANVMAAKTPLRREKADQCLSSTTKKTPMSSREEKNQLVLGPDESILSNVSTVIMSPEGHSSLLDDTLCDSADTTQEAEQPATGELEVKPVEPSYVESPLTDAETVELAAREQEQEQEQERQPGEEERATPSPQPAKGEVPSSLEVAAAEEMIAAPEPELEPEAETTEDMETRVAAWRDPAATHALLSVLSPKLGAETESVPWIFLTHILAAVGKGTTPALAAQEPQARVLVALWSFASLLQKPALSPTPEASSPSGGEGKRRRVAFVSTAGTCASPPNDRRPDSFMRTLEDATRLDAAVAQAELLADMLSASTAGAGALSANDVMSALVRVASASTGASREVQRLASAVEKELAHALSLRAVTQSTSTTFASTSQRPQSELRHRLSWMLSSVIRYSLRFVLDVPPAFISAPKEGGQYIEIPNVRSELHAQLKILPESSVAASEVEGERGADVITPPGSVNTTPTTPQSSRGAARAAAASISGSVKRKAVAKVEVKDHCSVATHDISLSALVTYALRQAQLERLFLARVNAASAVASDSDYDSASDSASDSDSASVSASGTDAGEAQAGAILGSTVDAWEDVLTSDSVKGSALLEVEALQVRASRPCFSPCSSCFKALPNPTPTPPSTDFFGREQGQALLIGTSLSAVSAALLFLLSLCLCVADNSALRGHARSFGCIRRPPPAPALPAFSAGFRLVQLPLCGAVRAAGSCNLAPRGNTQSSESADQEGSAGERLFVGRGRPGGS